MRKFEIRCRLLNQLCRWLGTYLLYRTMDTSIGFASGGNLFKGVTDLAVPELAVLSRMCRMTTAHTYPPLSDCCECRLRLIWIKMQAKAGNCTYTMAILDSGYSTTSLALSIIISSAKTSKSRDCSSPMQVVVGWFRDRVHLQNSIVNRESATHMLTLLAPVKPVFHIPLAHMCR